MRLSSRVKNISPSITLAITAKAKKMKKEGIDVISFGSGEPDFDTPQHIKKAGIEAIANGFTKYTPASGTDELKKGICKKLLEENRLNYNPSQIVVSCGAKHSLYNIIQVLCSKDDEIIIPSPYWVSYPEMVKLAEARPVFIKTSERHNFKITPLQFKRAITKRTRALILNTPSNPTGCIYKRDELEQIADIAIAHKIMVISDEIYEKIIYDRNTHISIASLNKDIFKNTIVVNGVSKSYSMTGWRIGYAACIDEGLTQAIKNLQSHSTSNPCSISQRAALEAIQHKGRWVEDMVREFKKRRDYIIRRVNNIRGLSCVVPEGAFYLFCKIELKNLTGMAVAQMLLDEAKVAVIPGEVFGSDRHIRLSFATSMANIKEGMNRIEWCLERSGFLKYVR